MKKTADQKSNDMFYSPNEASVTILYKPSVHFWFKKPLKSNMRGLK